MSAWDSSAVIVLNRGHALILLRGVTAPWEPNKWNLPGGMVEEGEMPLDAALRECKEETGLTPADPRFLTVVPGADSTLSVFVAQHKQGQKVNLNWEHDAFAWVSQETLRNYEFVPGIANVLHSLLGY